MRAKGFSIMPDRLRKRRTWGRGCFYRGQMSRIRAALAAVLVVLLVAVTQTAQAQTRRITDHAGDAGGDGARVLDVVSMTVHNRDRAVVTRVRFVTAVPGNVIVLLRPRNGAAVRIVHLHRRRGDRTVVAAGGFERPPEPVRCQGARGRWSDAVETVRLRLPASCLNEGSYRAIRVAVFTETPDGGDSDAADSRRFIRRG